jgi:hypothetical protein
MLEGIRRLWRRNKAKSGDWPPLPSSGFISGRVAQRGDVDRGDALYVLENSKPLAIVIPRTAAL